MSRIKNIINEVNKSGVKKKKSRVESIIEKTSNGNIKTDMLNDKRLEYDNIFILFADAVTIETRDHTETIMDTDGSGLGYYISRGALYEISWCADEGGSISFFNESGELLTVNRGSSYIAYVKSSNSANIKIS
jgi:hypothetical protein